MKCACGDKECGSEIVWDTGSHTLRAIWLRHWGYEGRPGKEVMLYYDANTLVELIKEAREALIELTEEGGK